MPLILFHSSKTMQRSSDTTGLLRQPTLLARTTELADYLKTLSSAEIANSMHLSDAMARKTSTLIEEWNTNPKNQSPAIDSFLGDMYSGLQAPQLSTEDRKYADAHLRILSGLYGVLRPLDGIMPYRLEMGYRFTKAPFDNLYSYWTEAIISQLPSSKLVFNLSSVEYTKSILPHLTDRTIVTPKFMTADPSSGEPRQVVVHSKIARGAYVRWLTLNKINSISGGLDFDLLGYSQNDALSSPNQPVFVCSEFLGTGLSIRLTQKR